MFDLFRSRDKAVRVLLGGLLGMVALSMLIYLIPGAGGMPGSGGSANEVVAEIGKEKVTAKDIQQLIQERLQNPQIPREMIQYMLPQLIDQAIADRAIAYEAQRRGFEVSDAELANTLRGMPNMASLPADQYKMYIEQMGSTVPEFEANLRKKLIVLRLQDIALESVVVTPQEVDKEYARRNDKIKLEYIAFDPAKLKTEVKPTPQDLQTYFANVRGQFTIPETRTFRVVVADPVAVGASLQLSDVQLLQAYNANKDQFRMPERVKARHILFSTQSKSKEDTEKIKLKAEGVLKQIKSGGDFVALAKQYSDDPSNKDKGGDLGLFPRGQMVKNFDTAAFSMKKGDISNLVSTEFGFHILQVMDKEEARLMPFDEVKGRIADQLKKGMVNDRAQALADQARAQIAKTPQNAEGIATQLGLTFAKAEKVKQADPLPVIGVDKGVADAVFGMKKGDVSPVMQAGNRLVIAVLDDVVAPRPAELAEVEAQVRDRYQTDQAAKLVTDRSKRAAELLKSNGGDLAAVAKSVGGEVKTTDWFSRQGAAEGIGSASYFESAFSKAPGTVIGAVNVGSQTVVAKVADKQVADTAKLAQERVSITQALKSKKAEERSQLFQDSIMTKLTEEGKVKVHRDVINRILGRYRAA